MKETKVITSANQNKGKYQKESVRTQSIDKQTAWLKRGKTRAREGVVDWFVQWRKLFRPITKQSREKPNDSKIILDTQLKFCLKLVNRRRNFQGVDFF